MVHDIEREAVTAACRVANELQDIDVCETNVHKGRNPRRVIGASKTSHRQRPIPGRTPNSIGICFVEGPKGLLGTGVCYIVYH